MNTPTPPPAHIECWYHYHQGTKSIAETSRPVSSESLSATTPPTTPTNTKEKLDTSVKSHPLSIHDKVAIFCCYATSALLLIYAFFAVGGNKKASYKKS